MGTKNTNTIPVTITENSYSHISALCFIPGILNTLYILILTTTLSNIGVLIVPTGQLREFRSSEAK